MSAAAATPQRRVGQARPLQPSDTTGAARQVSQSAQAVRATVGGGAITPGTARRMVVVSMLVVGGVVAYDLIKGEMSQTNGDLAFRTVWSVGLLFLLLAIMSDLVPELAGPFAGLVALAVLVGRSATVKQITQIVPAKGGKTA